jgi:hypothetical protein
MSEYLLAEKRCIDELIALGLLRRHRLEPNGTEKMSHEPSLIPQTLSCRSKLTF